MIALLIASSLAAMPFDRPSLTLTERICPPQGAMQTSATSPALLYRPEDRQRTRFRRLGDLPRANLEIAVVRSVGGCAVPVVIRYDVQGDGRAAKGAGQ
ncbi:MAG: hypothetical protein ABI655_07885 [Phenylobacterium sp.]